MHPRADRLLVANLQELLRRRGWKQKALARWCGKTETWISQILALKRRVLMDDLDRIADFFGYAPYQLFQPGIGSGTERRQRERRSGKERRVRTGQYAEPENERLQSDSKRHTKTPRPHSSSRKADPRAAPDSTTSTDIARIQTFLATVEHQIDQLDESAMAPHHRSDPVPQPPAPTRRRAPARGTRKALD